MLREVDSQQPEAVAEPSIDETPDGATKVQPDRATPLAESWGMLGNRNLPNTIRQIATLVGWTQSNSTDSRMLAIASAQEREGKSSFARALAITTAQDHAGSVLLIECDLLRPSLAGDFYNSSGPGLSEVLAGDAGFLEGLRATALPNLWLLPAGGVADNPARLLLSATMQELLDEAQERFQFIILDLPAVLKSSEAVALALRADGVVLVVRAGATDQRAIQQAMQLLSTARLHGVVLNRWRSKVPDIVRRLLGA